MLSYGRAPGSHGPWHLGDYCLHSGLRYKPLLFPDPGSKLGGVGAEEQRGPSLRNPERETVPTLRAQSKQNLALRNVSST